ncbi:general transcription factor 3C polypeptide 6 isoform X2 [Brachionus plicatilis]|uniref:General transcription factor 3C polypeptide 6 isoform X2 n=1 Tax=Brachionus plicatilis TaxID=10195 RepID=A0A3M7S039_BRAPC|nr:general transcription factor 3C polypeptide 6 isoform X2 [Brachionus plicatilis]
MNQNLNQNLENEKREKNQEVIDTEEEIEQESLVLIQFTDLDDAKYCEKFSNQFKSIEITKPNPIIQIGNRLYQGEYQNNIGTYLYFEEKKSQQQKTEHEYFGKSFKKLVLTRLFVEEKQN